MANTSAKGIFPIQRRLYNDLWFPIDAANPTALFVGDLVSMVAAGAVNKSVAGDANIVVGSVMELFDTNKLPIGGWNSLIATKYLTVSTAGYAVVALAIPGRLFIAQSDTILTTAAIGASTDHVVGTGSTVTARSANTINGGDLNTGAQFHIIGPYESPTNDITLASAKWVVSFNESYFAGTGKAAGV